MMVTCILLDAAIQQWRGCLTHNILYPCIMRPLLLLMPITMVFLAPLPPPLGFLLPSSTSAPLSIWLMLLGLHHIFKLATHTHHHLDHFHFLATSCMWLSRMNIGSLYSSSTYILFDIINKSCNFSLLVRLATNCPLELVSSCLWNPDQTSISRWHTLCIPSSYFSMPNIPF